MTQVTQIQNVDVTSILFLHMGTFLVGRHFMLRYLDTWHSDLIVDKKEVKLKTVFSVYYHDTKNIMGGQISFVIIKMLILTD